MKRLSFYAACLLLACHGASANETILEFDKANAGTRNLCGAPVKFVVITGMDWGKEVTVDPVGGKAHYEYTNLLGLSSPQAMCVYLDPRPQKFLNIPFGFDRCVIEDKQLHCFPK